MDTNRLSAVLLIRSVFVTALFASNIFVALAQGYPEKKPIRLVVQAPPGGGEDLYARMLGRNLSESWGQNVVVDNRPGASGIIATEIVARAASDGYTLLMVSSKNTITPSLYKKLPYNTAKDFAAVSTIATSVNVLIVHPSLPAYSVRELVALAKKRPGQLTYASAGVGSMTHFAGALFNSLARISAIHVPYKGSGPAEVEVIGGQVQYMIDSMPAALPNVKSGKTRALATTGNKRFPGLPEIPTVAESGLPGYESKQWWGILVPVGTPQSVISKLHSGIVQIMAIPAIKQAILNQGAEPRTSTSPEELMNSIKSEIDLFTEIAARVGIKAE